MWDDPTWRRPQQQPKLMLLIARHDCHGWATQRGQLLMRRLSILVKDGIPADRISTEGFGKEFATVPADATAAQRAVDRSIAMRFTK